ncbi:MAG: hypothetical protein E7262_09200 [Lachnospiraceae bacterium]|nr:hypothetical protein [Lachnospiraceae bacterium]
MRFFYADHVAIYEVIKSSISENNEFKGIIYRNEEVIEAKEAGYITYYATGSTRVAKGDLVFSIDEGANNTKSLKKNNGKIDIKDSAYETIADEVEYYRTNYSDAKFGDTYTFHNDINNMILELNTDALYSNIEEVIKDTGVKNIVIEKAKTTGLISHSTDGLEDITERDISTELFKSKKYNYETNITGELVEKDAPVYKIVNSDEWNIAIKLSKNQYKKLKDKDTIGVSFIKNNLSTVADIKVINNGGDRFAILTLSDYLINFIDDRFVNIQLAFNTATGLKIPNTSIVEKDFYVVPKKCFTQGGNSDSLGLIVKEYKKNGAVKSKFTETDIYAEEDDKYFVDKRLFELGTTVSIPGEKDTYSLNNVDTLQGVYCVNKGYCEFKNIVVKYSSDEYTIVEENSDIRLPIAKYDHIVLDATKDIEDKIIF